MYRYILDGYVFFKPFKDLQNMTFKCFNNLDFSWQWDMSASDSTNYFRAVDRHWKETHYGICLQCDKGSHLGKKLLLSGLYGMLYELYMQDPRKNDRWSCLKKVRQSFRVPASWKSLLDILQDMEESNWQTANIGGTVFEISCFMERSVRYSVSWR